MTAVMTETARATKSVLNPKYAAGPHGIGDPDDKSLRRVEIDVMIPKIMRDTARTQNCADTVLKFGDCCKKFPMSFVWKCRLENNVMKECLTKWYTDSDFQKLCTDKYLEERSEYRRTGIRKKFKRMGS